MSLADRFEGYVSALQYLKRVYLRPLEGPAALHPAIRLLAEW